MIKSANAPSSSEGRAINPSPFGRAAPYRDGNLLNKRQPIKFPYVLTQPIQMVNSEIKGGLYLQVEQRARESSLFFLVQGYIEVVRIELEGRGQRFMWAVVLPPVLVDSVRWTTHFYVINQMKSINKLINLYLSSSFTHPTQSVGDNPTVSSTFD